MGSAPKPAVSSSEFLHAIFGEKTPKVWVCSFPRVKTATWFGRRVGSDFPVGDHLDHYFAIAIVGDEAEGRLRSAVTEHYLVFADDVGGKMDPDRWATYFALGYPLPSFKIETSPGNETWGWIIDKPIERDDERRVKAMRVVRERMASLGLSDPLTDDARYIRLPLGHNSKEKYIEAYGAPVPVKMVEWMPERRLDIEQAATILAGPDWEDNADKLVGPGGASHAGTLHRVADMNNPEPILQLAQELGMNPVQVRPGVVEATCPNAAAHTTRGDTGFAFLGNGLMECNHGHCSHLRTPDFARMMMEQYDQQQAARVALGMPVSGPETAQEFLAAASFRYHGADSQSVAEIEDEVAGMEATSKRVVQEKEAKRAQSVADLADRFVWVQDAGLFFDTHTRQRYNKEQFEALEPVVRVIPVGSRGANKAPNQILNHPNTRFVATFAYVPGETSPIVDAKDEFGRVRPCANSWVGSFYQPAKGRPDTWLTHVGFIYDDPKAYEYVLDLMAWIVQNPAGRMSVVPLLLGDQGIGKDMVWAPLIDIIGQHNVMANMSPEKLVATFNDYVEHRLLIFPELRMADRRTYDAFKDLTSVDNRLITVNRKHAQPYKVRPAHITIAMTNNIDAICNLDPTDRRVWLHESFARRLDVVGDKSTPGSQAYFQHVKDTIDTQDEIERVLGFLLARDTSKFNPHAAAPDFSGAKEGMMLDTLMPGARYAYDAVKPGGYFDGRQAVTLEEVQAYVISHGGPNVQRTATANYVRDGISRAGCTSAPRLGTRENRVRLWFLPATPQSVRDEYAGLKGEAPRKRYEQEVEDWKNARLALAFPSDGSA